MLHAILSAGRCWTRRHLPAAKRSSIGLSLLRCAWPGSMPLADGWRFPDHRSADPPVRWRHLIADHVGANRGCGYSEERGDVLGGPPVVGQVAVHTGYAFAW